MKITNLKRDTARANEGEWVAEIPNCENLELKVRGMGSSSYVDAHAARLREIPHHKRDDKGNVRAEDAFAALGHALADAVLLDWQNIENEDGSPIKYSPMLAREWLTDLDSADFQTAVIAAAQRVDNLSRRASIAEDITKN